MRRPRNCPSDKNNFGPRVGFAVVLTGDGRTALRGGYGLYYGRIINSTIYNALINTGTRAGQNQASLGGAALRRADLPECASFRRRRAIARSNSFAQDFRQPDDPPGRLDLRARDCAEPTVSASYLFSLGRGSCRLSSIAISRRRPRRRLSPSWAGRSAVKRSRIPLFPTARPTTSFRADDGDCQ